jgi:MFS transporter, DHA1 family, inner membrane transport protein
VATSDLRPETLTGDTPLSAAHARWALCALALGGFAIGCTEFVLMGLLPDVAQSLMPQLYGHSPAQANAKVGWIISAYALGVVVGAPTIAAAAARLPRRQLLLGLLVVFTVGTVATALAPSFGFVLVARFVAALPHGAYFGIASLVAASVMGPGKRGQGIAFVLSGLAIANVVGVPLLTWLGQVSSWRIAYLMVAALFAVTFAAVLAAVPLHPRDPNATLRNELKAFSRLQVWFALLTGAIGFGGFFAVYTYIAPVATTVTGLSSGMVPVVLIVSGVGMTVGNLAGGRMSDRSVKQAMCLSFAVLLGALALMFFTARTLPGLLISVFAVTGAAFALAPAVQTRLMDVARESQSMAAALNHSALNAANALGAFLGGLTLAGGFGYLSPVLVGFILGITGIALALTAFGIERATSLTPPAVTAEETLAPSPNPPALLGSPMNGAE